MDFNTRLLHSQSRKWNPEGSIIPPISQVSAFAYETSEDLEKVFTNRKPGFSYSRIGNPTVSAFERKINELEGGVLAVATSSGMSAVTLSLLNILTAGDEIIAGSGLFGGTIDLFRDLKAFGITTRYVDHISVSSVEPLINNKTRVIFGEVIGNPALDIIDIRAIAELAHSHNLPFIVDATTATPYLVNPLRLGADVVVHSTSKYINGGGNSISGIIVDGGSYDFAARGYYGFDEYISVRQFQYAAKLRNGIWRNMGACLAPLNAFMNMVGLDTLGLRMERICSNAYGLAKALSGIKGITVNYPLLTSSPYRDLALTQLGGKGGGIVTIRVGSKENAFKLMDSLKFAYKATNIGDVRTLAIHPASTIYFHSDEKAREAAGVYHDTIRISVGIEDINDLIEDFTQAINKLGM